MPTISIVIPAYNVENYIRECLDSVKSQTFSDFEAIVVDDASTDTTLNIIKECAANDSRFKVVCNASNQGRHLTRKIGVKHISGEYTLFLDGDDALAPTMLEDLATQLLQVNSDAVHYGITVLPVGNVSNAEADDFARYINAPADDSTGELVLGQVFDEAYKMLVDWRVTQRIVRSSIVKKAFECMVDKRLDRAEDGYECFVLCDQIKSCAFFNDIQGYIYRYGAGITGSSKIDIGTFDSFCHQFDECVKETLAYVEQHGDAYLFRAYEGMRRKMLELLSNEILVRVDPSEWREAIGCFSRTFGPDAALRELYRFACDEAYPFVKTRSVPSSDNHLYLFLDLAKTIDPSCIRSEDTVRMEEAKKRIEDHLAFIERLSRGYAMKPSAVPEISIFITTHKEVSKPNSDILQLVQVGPGLIDNRFPDTFHDDDGQSISDKNPYYCELTTQYWAWKNVNCDYVGFCHYRRYFNFSQVRYEENPYFEVMDDYIDDDAVKLYGLDDQSILSCVKDYDLITTGVNDISCFPEEFSSVREHYESAPALHIADLDRMMSIVTKHHPDYAQDIENYLSGTRSCFCNMYIMRKTIFDSYCEWLFPLLDEFFSTTDMSRYSVEALRTPGHLAERLSNIYFGHAKRIGAGWKTKELQCVHFTKPEKTQPFASVFSLRKDFIFTRTIPVVLASDNGYVPMVTTTISSMLENASKDRFYDVVILEKDISHDNKDLMKAHFADYGNVSLRFCNVARMISSYILGTNNPHISIETYYRFIIQDIMPYYSKVLYLDSDLVVCGDIAELYDTEIGDSAIGAVRDIDYLANLNCNDGARLEYTTKQLKMRNPYDYFQAGVLILNTDVMRQIHSVEEWLRIASESTDYIYNDQDILNAECEGRVTYIGQEWNVMHNCFGRTYKLFPLAPADVYREHLSARKHPHVIHFAGAEKPWTNPSCDYADVYWRYARKTPFYELLLHRASLECVEAHSYKPVPVVHENAISEDSKLRMIIDPIAPLGSRRREVMKSIVRAIRGKK